MLVEQHQGVVTEIERDARSGKIRPFQRQPSVTLAMEHGIAQLQASTSVV